jgi:hypothetical protein
MKSLYYRISGVTLFISVVAYAVSLTQVAYCTQSSCVYSIGSLLTGWIALYMGGVMFTWLANPLILISWITIRRSPRTSNLCSITACILMFSFLYYKQIYNHQDEWTSDITKYGVGYYLWVLSGITMVVGNVYIESRRRRPRSVVNSECSN